MRNTFVIAGREFVEKRFVLVTAFAFALLGLLIPFFPGIRAPFAEVIWVSSGGAAVVFVLGLAVILGASVIGRELRENRLSFYFSRPVSAASIWFGKLLGSAALAVASFLIVGGLAMAAGAPSAIQTWIPDRVAFIGLVACAAAFLFFLAHFVGTIVRSQSAWIAADFVCLGGSVASACAIFYWPLRAHAITIAEAAAIVITIGVASVGLLSGAWQLWRGRTDRRLSHVALSSFLWLGVAVVLGVAAGYVVWGLSVSPDDLTEVSGAEAGHGWLLISGSARHRGDYRPVFIINTVNRHVVRIGAPPWWYRDSAQSGSTVAWVQQAAIGGGLKEVMICRLDAANPHPEPTGITTPENGVSLSTDGKRILVGWSNFSIYDLATRRSLGSFRIGDSDSYSLAYFASPSLIRIHTISRDKPGKPAFTTISEYDLTTRTLRQTGQTRGRPLGESADGVRMLVLEPDGSVLRLVDASSGKDVAVLSSSGLAGRACFLSDETIALSVREGGTVVVRHLSRDGVLLREVPLGRYYGGSVTAGNGHRAIVELDRAQFVPAALAVVDLDRGVVERIDTQLHHTVRGGSFDHEVLCQSATSIVAWNLSTGAKRLIVGR